MLRCAHAGWAAALVSIVADMAVSSHLYRPDRGQPVDRLAEEAKDGALEARLQPLQSCKAVAQPSKVTRSPARPCPINQRSTKQESRHLSSKLRLIDKGYSKHWRGRGCLAELGRRNTGFSQLDAFEIPLSGQSWHRPFRFLARQRVGPTSSGIASRLGFQINFFSSYSSSLAIADLRQCGVPLARCLITAFRFWTTPSDPTDICT